MVAQQNNRAGPLWPTDAVEPRCRTCRHWRASHDADGTACYYLVAKDQSMYRNATERLCRCARYRDGAKK